MSRRFIDQGTTENERLASVELYRHFAEHARQFPLIRRAIDRLAANASKFALKAATNASRPGRASAFIKTADHKQWHKDAALMENIFLCHRPMVRGAEFGIVEIFLALGVNEVGQRSWDAAELLQAFIREQREVLQVWQADLLAQVIEFLAGRFRDLDSSRVAGEFMRHVTGTALWTMPTQLQSVGLSDAGGRKVLNLE